MAFGKKYELQFQDQKLTVWDIEVYLEGFVGVSTAIRSTGTPVNINWKGSGELFDIMKSSECTFRMSSDSDFQFSEFFTADLGAYYIKVIKGGTDFWTGTLPAQTVSEPYKDTPYPSKLRFTDGLSDLKGIRYDDGAGSLFEGIDSALDIIQKCLNKIGDGPAGGPGSSAILKPVREIINVFENSMTAKTVNDGLLQQLMIDQGVFIFEDVDETDRGWFCYDVIVSILRPLGCRLFQYNDIWWIVRVEEMAELTPRFVEFTSGGVFSSSGTQTMRKDITNLTGAATLTHDRAANMTIGKISNRLVYQYEYSFPRRPDLDQLIRNWNFIGFVQVPPNEPIPVPSIRFWTDNLTGGSATAVVLFQGIAGLRIPRAVLAEVDKVDNFDPDDFLLTAAVLNSWIRPIDKVGSTVTQTSLAVESNDNMRIDLQFFPTIFALQSGFVARLLPWDYVYKIFMMVKIDVGAGAQHLTGTPDSLSWTAAGAAAEYIEIEVHALIEAVGTRAYGDFIDFTTPNWPVTGIFDFEIKVFCPVTQTARLVVGGSASGAIRMDTMDFPRISCIYLSQGQQTQEVIADISLSVTSDVREIEKKWKVNHGDGPNQASMGSFRRNDANNSPTVDWHKRGAGAPFDSARDEFLFDPAKLFLSENRQQIKGKLLAATSGGYVNFWNSLVEPGGKVFAIDSMNYDVKAAEFNTSLIELISFVRSWVDVTPDDHKPAAPLVNVIGGPIVIKDQREIVETDFEASRPDIDGAIGATDIEDWAAYPPSAGPVDYLGHWSFQDPPLGAVSVVEDYSQNGNPSTRAANVTAVAGDIGQAGRFNGATSEVDLPNITTFNGAAILVVTARINKDLNQAQTIIRKEQVFRLEYLVGGKVDFSVYIGGAWRTVLSTSTPTTAAWHTLTGFYDGRDLKIYTDGVLDSVPVAQVGALNSNANIVSIGYDNAAAGNHFDGDIEIINAYNKALTATQIAQLDDTPSGILITTTDTHFFEEGDLLSVDQFEANRAQMICTFRQDTTNFRAYPVEGTPIVTKSIGKYGNCFEIARQASSVYQSQLISGVYHPELLFFDQVSTFAEYDTVAKEVARIDRFGITSRETRGLILGYDLTFSAVNAIVIGLNTTFSVCKDSTNTYNMEITSPLTLNTGGVGVNGIDAAPLLQGMWQVFIIGDSTGVNVTASIMSLGIPPVLPVGYDIWRLIGYVAVNAATNIINFLQQQNGFNGSTRSYYYDDTIANLQVLTAGVNILFTTISLVNFVPSIPVPFALTGHFQMRFTGTTAAGNGVWFRPLGSAVATPIRHFFEPSVTGAPNADAFDLALVDPTLEYRVDNALDSADLYIAGYTHQIPIDL